MKIKFLKIVILISLFASHSVKAEIKIQPWSEGVFEQINKEYGAAAEQRMHNIYQLILKYQNKSLSEKLEVTNRTLNKLPWLSDREKWSQDDYWATPYETLTQFGGDCEDMAIGKLVVLRLMGVPKRTYNWVM